MKGSLELLGIAPSSSNMARWALRRRMNQRMEAGERLPTLVTCSNIFFRVSRTYMGYPFTQLMYRRGQREGHAGALMPQGLDEPITDGGSDQLLNPYRQVTNAFSRRVVDRVGDGGRGPDIGKLANPLDACRVHVAVLFRHQYDLELI